MLTLFVISTLDNWGVIMNIAINSNTADIVNFIQNIFI